MRLNTFISAIILAIIGSTGTPAIAARGVCKDGTPPPCKPGTPGEDPTAVNRLAYPGLLVPGLSVAPFFTVTEGTFGETYSYGCAKEQIINIGGTDFTYPNTTCALLNAEGLADEWLDAAACTAAGAPCDGYSVDRIYWQKQSDNLWSAQATGIADALPLTARFLDWGDSIEVVTWNENSVLRVETQAYADLTQDPCPAEIPAGLQTGFQMWHVAGQGTTEQWGVRTTEAGGEQGLPYAYSSPYAIINAGTADLYLTKLFRESADDTVNTDGTTGCPIAGGDNGPAYPIDYPFDNRSFLPGIGWSNSCNLPEVAYTVELSVSGKYVHGYN